MAKKYPMHPIAVGDSAQIIGAHDVEYTIRAVTTGLWIVDGLPGMQSEVRDLGGGSFQVMHTNGTARQTMTFPSWREAMAHGF